MPAAGIVVCLYPVTTEYVHEVSSCTSTKKIWYTLLPYPGKSPRTREIHFLEVWDLFGYGSKGGFTMFRNQGGGFLLEVVVFLIKGGFLLRFWV